MNWSALGDPWVAKLVGAAAALIVLVLAARLWQRRREAAAERKRRGQLRRTYDQMQSQQRELGQLAGQIVATSSTATIAGFEILRQIEAVFAEAAHSPGEAVELLKAEAARKGANALINLNGQRLPSGRCVASGDAVIVRAALSVDPGVRGGKLEPGNGQRGLDRTWD